MVKILPAFIALICGLAIGWIARGPGDIKSATTAADSPSRKTQRPTPARTRSVHPTAGSVSPATLTEKLSASSQPERRQWLDQIDASNWRAYLDGALSDEGASRNLLTEPNIENLEFLHRIGEISKEEGVRVLLDRKLHFAAAEAMEGWATLEPRAAFIWVTDAAGKNTNLENSPVYVKAAGAMVDVDFNEVWKHVRMIPESLAKEFIRRKGVAEMDRILLHYWTSPEDNRLPREDFLPLNHVFWDWRRTAEAFYHLEITSSNGEDKFQAYRRNLLEINNRLLAQPLRPEIRQAVERRNGQLIRNMAAPTH
ncbi:hypothetical protein OVA24_20180 [Luteolibacter sp. SL250]|uniref:hypothetical protein n=1 Tax=Luteolibacter sp. SL250 TaxID=2995170 RepID=UPI00226DBCD5|nr:hypothetical protein [Luteolibacter sp. SL250]WAC19545.1 hypothetical protein OVA24_20180 [Luteolibacter sp. SL250]